MQYWLNAGFVALAELTALARAAEALGFAGIAMPDHLFFPERIASSYPYSEDGSVGWPADTPWADPWVAIAAMGAVTTKLRFSTGVQIAPLRDPFSLAKAISTAHQLTAGRIRCGLGVGWLREEFDVLGIDFVSRGRRFDEMIEVLRLLWTGETVSHSGEFFKFESIRMCPAARDVPIDIGGTSAPAIRRAVNHDGWIVPHRGFAQTARLIERLTEVRSGARTNDRNFCIGLTGPDLIGEDFGRLDSLGVTSVTLPIGALGRARHVEDRVRMLGDLAGRLGIA